MTQKLLIIALILVVIYLAYQQTTQPNLLATSAHSAQLTHLAQERNHYQTLYQKRVQKDLANDQTQKIQQLTTNLAEAREAKTLFQQKATDLETSLLNLAKQKIKNHKEANQLLEQLEVNWKTEKETWQQEQDKQAQSLAQERKNFYEKIRELEKSNQKTQGHQQVILNKIDNFLKL